jgi:hypothetical protein
MDFEKKKTIITHNKQLKSPSYTSIFPKTLISNVITLESITCPKFVEKNFNFLISNVSITHFFMDYDPRITYITKSIFHWMFMLLV